MLTLKKYGSHQWEFAYPPIFEQVMDEFHMGCEFLEQGDLDKAEKTFKSVLAKMPDHLDALHHLALVLSERDLHDQAGALWVQAVNIGRKAFPPDFVPGKDRLEWLFMDNRPFLRCLHGLALERFDQYLTEMAAGLFRELLLLNPNDNQGARAMLQECLFELSRFEDALEIADEYPGDIMPDTLYGKALALFKLGRKRQANAALRKAVKILPLVRVELLKKRHRMPKSAQEGLLTVGGADEAYYYWEQWGRFWKADAEALKWLEKIPPTATG